MTDPPSEQYKIMPFQLVVLIEQNNIQDLLVALENSPMAIQVSEFAIAKPAADQRPDSGAPDAAPASSRGRAHRVCRWRVRR